MGSKALLATVATAGLFVAGNTAQAADTDANHDNENLEYAKNLTDVRLVEETNKAATEYAATTTAVEPVGEAENQVAADYDAAVKEEAVAKDAEDVAQNSYDSAVKTEKEAKDANDKAQAHLVKTQEEYEKPVKDNEAQYQADIKVAEDAVDNATNGSKKSDKLPTKKVAGEAAKGEELPETGEADAYALFGAASLAVLAGVGLAAPALRKED